MIAAGLLFNKAADQSSPAISKPCVSNSVASPPSRRTGWSRSSVFSNMFIVLPQQLTPPLGIDVEVIENIGSNQLLGVGESRQDAAPTNLAQYSWERHLAAISMYLDQVESTRCVPTNESLVIKAASRSSDQSSVPAGRCGRIM